MSKLQPFLLLLACGLAVSGARAQESVVNHDTALSPWEFGDKVREAGGLVNFAFGAERPFPQCHASTVVEVEPGVLIAAWFAGTEEKSPDVGIWHARFEEKKWSEPTLLVKVNDTAHWNPVLFRDQDNTLYLFFKVGPEIPHWQTYWMRSEDGGKTWSDAVELVPGDKGGRGPVRSKPIVLSDGAWLAGASTELGTWIPFADRSTDGGKTWTRSEDFVLDKEKLKGKGAIQPTLWESAPGKVHALLRTTGGKVWRADSEDGGITWSEAYETALPNNNSGIEVLYLPESKRLYLVYNPVGGNWAPRTPLDLAVSTDNGQTWTTVAHLEHDADRRSEFSYPAMIQTADGIAITYTYQRERVRCWQIPLAALE